MPRHSYQNWSQSQPPSWRRVFAGDNPLTWSIPIGSAAGISVRVSIVYVVWMILELLGSTSWEFKAWMVGTLFVLVLLHEFGHCIACRRVGGEADDILLWMLGGLAYCRPPHTWRANFITVAGGPLVNVALVPVFAAAMLALGAPLRSLIFFPFGNGSTEAWGLAVGGMTAAPVWLRSPLFLFYLTNLSLLLFNVLLPMFPMDGGRLLQALLWRRHGFEKSMWIATRVGLAAAVIVGVAGLYLLMTSNSWMLLAIAVMCGMTCYNQQQMLRVMAAQGVFGREPWVTDPEAWKSGPPRGRPGRTEKQDAKRRERAAREAQAERTRAQSESAELDRILAKIKEKGMASLSNAEQAFLRSSTQRSREQ